MHKRLPTTTGHITITIPDKLEQVTLGQLIAMQAAEKLSDLEAISILSGTPVNDLQNIINIHDLNIFNNQVAAIAGEIKALEQTGVVPRKVVFTMDNKKVAVKVPNNLSIEPVGVFMASREIIADEINKHVQQHGETYWQQYFNPSLTACAQVLAQYFYCRATGKPYNEYAAAAFEEQVKQLPVTDALPISNYFFLNYPNLSKPRTAYWPRLRRLWSSAPG